MALDSYPLDIFEDKAISMVRKAQVSLGGGDGVSYRRHKMSDYDFMFFELAENLGMKPNEAAEKIIAQLGDNDHFERIEAKGPYVNFYINSQKLAEITMSAISDLKNKYGQHGTILNKDRKQAKVILEHTSANPTGPLHVGRARNPIIGDTMARLLRKRGFDVEVQFYVDDMGKQLVILTWGHDNIRDLDVEGERADHKFVKYYQKANELMEQNPDTLAQINELIAIYEEGQPEISAKVHDNCQAILDGMLEAMRRLDVQYDSFAWESKYVRDGSVADVIKKLEASDYTDWEDGALYLDLEEFDKAGKENKLYLTRSDGTSLYTTRDIAYHLEKLDNSDIAINVLGEDHKLKAWAVNQCLSIMGEGDEPVEVIFYAFVSLPEGKMSTRKGQVVYVDDLIEEAVSRALAEVEKRRPELPEEIKQGIAETVGIGAIRYNIIRVQPEKQMVFRWEEALNFEGNSAPFIQYSHARASSILRKEQSGSCDYSLLVHPTERALIKTLARFPSTLKKCADDRSPHLMATYAYELASNFNQFYRDCQVLGDDDAALKNSRLALVECSKIVLQNALDTLGIIAPEEM